MAAHALIDVGRFLFEQGWVPATSGNLSARLEDGSILMTVSGRHKGELTTHGLMRIDADGEALEPDKRPSAEAGLHVWAYRRFPNVRAVLHTHSPRATVLSRHRPALSFEGYEINKAFEGIDTHESQLTLPVFKNDQDIARLTQAVDAHPDVRHGFLIEGHGLYTWGPSVFAARRHVEAIELLLQCTFLEHALKGTP